MSIEVGDSEPMDEIQQLVDEIKGKQSKMLDLESILNRIADKEGSEEHIQRILSLV